MNLIKLIKQFHNTRLLKQSSIRIYHKKKKGANASFSITFKNLEEFELYLKRNNEEEKKSTLDERALPLYQKENMIKERDDNELFKVRQDYVEIIKKDRVAIYKKIFNKKFIKSLGELEIQSIRVLSDYNAHRYGLKSEKEVHKILTILKLVGKMHKRFSTVRRYMSSTPIPTMAGNIII